MTHERCYKVRKAEMDLKNAQKRLAVSQAEEKEALSRILDSVHVDRDMVSSPLQSQKELYKRKLKEGKISSAEYETLIEKLPKEKESIRRFDSETKKVAGALLDSHKGQEEVSFRKKPNMDDPDLKDARHDSQELTPFPVVEGYLYKKTHRGQRWIRRYFIFRNEFLLWFNTEKDAHQDDARVPNGILPVLEVVRVFNILTHNTGHATHTQQVRVVKADLDIQLLMKKGGQMQLRCNTFQSAYEWYASFLRRMAWFQDSSVRNMFDLYLLVVPVSLNTTRMFTRNT